MDKKLVLVDRVNLSYSCLFDGESLDDAIVNLMKFKVKLENDYASKGMVISKIITDYHYDCTESYINIHRLETDEEYATRIQYELEKAEQKRIKKEELTKKKAEQNRISELKELSELEELRKRVAELEKKHNVC